MQSIKLFLSGLVPVSLFAISPLLGACDEPADSAAEQTSERAPLGKADAIGSCLGPAGTLCGGPSEGNCWCDDQCESYGDCCADKPQVCDAPALCLSDVACADGEGCDQSFCFSNCAPGQICPAVCWGQCLPVEPVEPVASCVDACGGQSDAGCYCDELCSEFGDCCGDVDEVCGGAASTCETLVPALASETTTIRACELASQCGQVLTGTSCGCTRNWVARNDADLGAWNTLRDEAQALGCEIPGTISTCDCPATDGFACEQGVCTWNYL